MFRHTRLALSFVMPDPDRASRPLSSVAPLRRIYAWKTVALRATPPTASRRAPPSNSRGWLRFSKHIPFSAALLVIGRRQTEGLSLRFWPRQDPGVSSGPVAASFRVKVAVFLPRQDCHRPQDPVAAEISRDDVCRLFLRILTRPKNHRYTSAFRCTRKAVI